VISTEGGKDDWVNALKLLPGKIRVKTFFPQRTQSTQRKEEDNFIAKIIYFIFINLCDL